MLFFYLHLITLSTDQKDHRAGSQLKRACTPGVPRLLFTTMQTRQCIVEHRIPGKMLYFRSAYHIFLGRKNSKVRHVFHGNRTPNESDTQNIHHHLWGHFTGENSISTCQPPVGCHHLCCVTLTSGRSRVTWPNITSLATASILQIETASRHWFCDV